MEREISRFRIDTLLMAAITSEKWGTPGLHVGFGMRYAITSGVLAAKSVMGELDYEKEVRGRLLPLVKASATNRFLMNRMGDRGFEKLVARYWMRIRNVLGMVYDS